jgi:hypothetical protein
MERSEKKEVVLGVRIAGKVRDALWTAAEGDRRTMSFLANDIIVEWLRARDFLKDESD